MRRSPLETKYKNLQNAAVATGNGNALVVGAPGEGAYDLVAFQVTGTMTSLTVTFEGTVQRFDTDQTTVTWVALEVESISAITSNVRNLVTTATAGGVWRVPVKGLYAVRARISTYASGNCTVDARAVA